MYLLKKLSITIFLLFIISCSGIESHQVKLEDFNKPTEEQIKKIDLQYNNAHFMEYQYDNYKVKHKKPKSKNPPKCLVNSLVGDTNKLLTCPLPTNLIAPITLYIIPYYCAAHYTADAGLLFKTNKIDSEGDPVYEVVKEFELKDKVHELWSSLWMLNPFAWDEPTPKVAKSRTHHRISEAMVRQVINEALSRKECYIDEKDYYKYIAKKQQQEKEELEKKQKEEEERRKNSWWRF